MLSFIRHAGIVRPQASAEKAHELGAKNSAVRLACWGCVLCCLLVLASGCSKKRRSAEHVEVTGKVTYKGKPVTGGMVTFVAPDGFASKGIIDENGNYSIKAPVGDVKISVDNKMLLVKKEAASRGAGRPQAAGGVEATPIKGKYIPLPSKCSAPDTSGLSYTVTSGQQTHDIVLAD